MKSRVVYIHYAFKAIFIFLPSACYAIAFFWIPKPRIVAKVFATLILLTFMVASSTSGSSINRVEQPGKSAAHKMPRFGIFLDNKTRANKASSKYILVMTRFLTALGAQDACESQRFKAYEKTWYSSFFSAWRCAHNIRLALYKKRRRCSRQEIRGAQRSKQA